MLWFLSVAAKRGFCVNCYRDDAVSEMTRNDDNQLVISKVRQRPNVELMLTRLIQGIEAIAEDRIEYEFGYEYGGHHAGFEYQPSRES